MNKIILKYGIVSGLIGVFSFLIVFFLGVPSRGNLFIIIFLLITLYLPSFLSIKQYKKANNNEVTFYKALWIGIASGFIASLVIAVYSAVYYYILNPDYATSDIKDLELVFKQMGVKGVELAKQMELEKQKLSPLNELYRKFIGSIFFSLIMALVNALFFFKKD